MASRANRKQILIVAMYEALIDMIYDQSNQQIKDGIEYLRDDCINACTVCYLGMIADPNGGLRSKDVIKVKAVVDKFRDTAFSEFEADTALSLCICLITDQISIVKNEYKKQAFEDLLHTAENLLWYFDPDGVSQDREGYDAAQIIEKLTS